jgi:hypothetical protein
MIISINEIPKKPIGLKGLAIKVGLNFAQSLKNMLNIGFQVAKVQIAT